MRDGENRPEVKADQERRQCQGRDHQVEVRRQHADRKHRPGQSRHDRRGPQFPAIVAAADPRHDQAAGQRAGHAEQALERAGIGADLRTGQVMNAGEEGRNPGRGRVVRVGGQAEADQHDDEGLLRQQERQRRAQRLGPGGSRCGIQNLGIHGAACRLRHRQPQHGCQRDAGQPGGHERHPPAIVLVDPAADEIAQEDAEISADGVDAECARAFVLAEKVGHQRLRGRRSRRLADADPDAGQREGRDARGEAATKCHRAPEGERHRHDVAPVQAVGNARDRDAEDRIEQHEAEAGEQPHHGVAERELLLDRLDQDVEDGAVEKVEGIDCRQQPQHIVAPHWRRRADLRRCGRFWSVVDHRGSSPTFFMNWSAWCGSLYWQGGLANGSAQSAAR